MKIYGIVAAAENNVIGIGQNIPWHLPEDFKFFKATTLDHYIIMGKNTWLTFAKPLPRRKHVIISSTLDKEDVPNDVLIFTSLDKALQGLKELGVAEAFIIGGGQLYKEALPLMEKVYITRVHTEIDDGTAFFPKLIQKDWSLKEEEPHEKDHKHQYDFTFQTWERK